MNCYMFCVEPATHQAAAGGADVTAGLNAASPRGKK
jgi:hypothetical protein